MNRPSEGTRTSAAPLSRTATARAAFDSGPSWSGDAAAATKPTGDAAGPAAARTVGAASAAASQTHSRTIGMAAAFSP
jgi:hypothetical protein